MQNKESGPVSEAKKPLVLHRRGLLHFRSRQRLLGFAGIRFAGDKFHCSGLALGRCLGRAQGAESPIPRPFGSCEGAAMDAR